LRERLAAHSLHGITVIEDPYESEHAREPRLAPGPVLRLAWFGAFAPVLRPFLEAQFAAIARALGKRPVELAFVTSPTRAAIVHDMARALKEVNPAFRVRHVAWSLSDAARELENADIVVLPQDVDSDWGRVKSHNRLVESIRAGRFAIASPIPAYLEMAQYAWVGADLASGLEWALTNRMAAVERVRAGQAYVAERFEPARIAAKWADVLDI
jgi:glycosyltransferase involved in cell wall biosynthesis